MTPQQSYPSYESNNNNNVGELTGYRAPRSVPIMSHKNQTTPKNCQTTPEPETLPDLLSSSILPPSAPMEPYDMRPKPTPMQQPAPAERPHGTCTTPQQQQPTIVGANVQFRSALDRPPKENTANTPAAHDPTPTTIAPPTDPTTLILQAYDHHPESVTATTISDSHSSSSSTVLLSMYKTDAPPKPNIKKFDTDECDRVVYQATEAALYAEELIQQQQQTRGWFSLRKQRRHNDTPRQRPDDDHPKKDTDVNEHKTNKDKLRDTAASKIRSTPNHKPQFSMTKHANTATEPPLKQKNSDTYKTAVPAWSAMTQQQQKQTPDDTTVPRWATQPRPNRNHNDPPDQTTASSVVGASLLGAVAGTMVLGPVGAVAAASGAAYAALNKKRGTVGSMVRGAGSVVAKVGGTAVSKGAAVVVGGQQRRKPSSKHNNNNNNSDKNKGFQSYNPP